WPKNCPSLPLGLPRTAKVVRCFPEVRFELVDVLEGVSHSVAAFSSPSASLPPEQGYGVVAVIATVNGFGLPFVRDLQEQTCLCPPAEFLLHVANKAIFACCVQWIEPEKWLGTWTPRKVLRDLVRREIGNETLHAQRAAIRDETDKGATETHVRRGVVELALKRHEELVVRGFWRAARGSHCYGMIFITHRDINFM